MNRIPPVDRTTATGPTGELLDTVQRAFGKVPNGIEVLANAPAALEAWWAFELAIDGSRLPRPVQEQIALLSANYNSCGYCLSAHTAAARAVGVSPEDLAAAKVAEASDPFAASVLALASAVLTHRGDVPDDVLADARGGGLTDADILDTVALLAINAFSNYYNRLAHTALDYPPAEFAEAS
jgi:uncharacterized peroxidase-related enzyme